MPKSLVSYTTQIQVERTIMEIEQVLVKFGAINISKKYENGIPVAIAFQYNVNNQPMSFKLPMEGKKIVQVFNNQVKAGKLPKRFRDNEEQANRVGWRIIGLWIKSQISLMEIHAVVFEQVFLPFAYDVEHDETLYEKFKKRGFNLQIGYGKNGTD